MRVDNKSPLSSTLAFKKEFKLHKVYWTLFWEPLQPIGQAAEYKFESKFKPLPTSAGPLAITPSHSFEVNELLDDQWAKIVQSENILTPIYVECYKMYQSKVCVQEFWYCLGGLDIQPELS